MFFFSRFRRWITVRRRRPVNVVPVAPRSLSNRRPSQMTVFWPFHSPSLFTYLSHTQTPRVGCRLLIFHTIFLVAVHKIIIVMITILVSWKQKQISPADVTSFFFYYPTKHGAIFIVLPPLHFVRVLCAMDFDMQTFH